MVVSCIITCGQSSHTTINLPLYSPTSAAGALHTHPPHTNMHASNTHLRALDLHAATTAHQYVILTDPAHRPQPKPPQLGLWALPSRNHPSCAPLSPAPQHPPPAPSSPQPRPPATTPLTACEAGAADGAAATQPSKLDASAAAAAAAADVHTAVAFRGGDTGSRGGRQAGDALQGFLLWGHSSRGLSGGHAGSLCVCRFVYVCVVYGYGCGCGWGVGGVGLCVCVCAHVHVY
jgi:hypothetical protein